MKSIWWNYLRSVHFFEDAFGLLLFAYLGIRENKLGPHFHRIENQKFIGQIEEIEKRGFGFVDKHTVMKSCLFDEFYLINSSERPSLEVRVPSCKLDIDMLEKYKAPLKPYKKSHQELPPIDLKKQNTGNNLEVEIPRLGLAPTMSMPVKRLEPLIQPSSPTSPWRRVSTVMKGHSTFDEVKKRRMTITSQNLLAKIQEMQKKVEKDSSSDEEPVTEVRFKARRSTNILPVVSAGGQMDKAFVAKLGCEFHLIFSRIQEQIYDVTTMYSKKIEEASRSSRRKASTELIKATSVGGKPVLPLGQSPGVKQSKGRSIVKLLKPRIRIEKLTDEEVADVRKRLLAERKVYKQKSVKTEEAAEIERYVANKIFSESSTREKEYLCLGASVFLK